MSLIRKNPSVKLRAANRSNSLRSTGPRTERGISNSSRNAGKHLVFARVCAHSMKELGEDPEELEKLRQTLWGALCPQDAFEEMLVGEMAVNRFRLGRLQRAEAGILALQKMRVEHKIRHTLPQSQPGYDNLSITTSGLASVSDSPEKYLQILDLLHSVHAKVEKEGFSTQGLRLLETVYGKFSPGVTGSGLLAKYKAGLEGQNPDANTADDVKGAAARRSFLDTLLRDIETFTFQAEALRRAQTMPLPQPALDSLMLLPQDELEKIMRYEAHLERQFQWKLQQLMAWRKACVDLPGAEARE
jgi:hypothetical protein